MRAKSLVSLLLLVIMVASLSVLGPSRLVKANEKLNIGVFVSYMGNPYFVTLANGAKAAGKDLGVNVTIYDGQDKPSVQIRQVEDRIAARDDAIVLNPTDAEALVPAVKKANKAGIPVVSADRDVTGGKRLCYVGTSNVKAAEKSANTLLDFLEKSGKPKPWRIVILEGIPGASSAREREEGFHNVLDPLRKSGDIQVIADLTAYFDKAKGLSVMEDVLSISTDIDAVIAANDNMALGALKAIEEAGLKVGFPDGILIMGFDAIQEAVDAVAEGKFVGTMAQAPYIQGYWGVEAAVRHIREGWTPPKGTPTYKTGALMIATPAVVVTKQNVDKVEELTKTVPPLPGTG